MANAELLQALDQWAASRGGGFGSPTGGYGTNPLFAAAMPQWQPFRSPLANMAFGGVQGMVSNRMMGGQWPSSAPVLPGMDPFMAHYVSRSTGPAISHANQLLETNVARMGGRLLGGVSDAFGLRKFIAPEMSSAEWAKNMSDMASGSSAGRMITGAVMRSGVMQGITGGDVFGGMQRMYGAGPLAWQGTKNDDSSMWGGVRGGLVQMVGKDRKIDYSIGLDHAEKTSGMQDRLMSAMFGTGKTETVDGKEREILSAVPKMAFTRGFDTGRIADLHTMMTERGFDGYRAADADGKVARMDKQLNALSSLSSASGETDLGALSEIYNRFAGGHASSVDPDTMAKAFDKMSAMATVFGKEGKGFVEAAMKLQQTMAGHTGQILGGSSTAMLDSGGNVRGGMGHIDVATQLARDTYAIASHRGDVSERGINAAGEELMAAQAIWTGSTQGKDAMLIEYIKQTEGVSSADSAAWDKAMKSGDKTAQADAAAAIFRRSSLGSTAAARAALDNPAFRTGVMASLGKDEVLRLNSLGMDTMVTEYKERLGDQFQASASANMQQLAVDMGGSLTLDKFDQARVDAMAKATGDKDLEAAVHAAYANGGMSEVRQMMNSAGLSGKAGVMERAGEVAKNEALLAELNKEGSLELHSLTAGANLLRGMSGVDDDLTSRLESAIASGDTGLARDLMKQARGAAGGRGVLIDREMESAEKDFIAKRDISRALMEESTKLVKEGGDGKSGVQRRIVEAAGGLYKMMDFLGDWEGSAETRAESEALAEALTPIIGEQARKNPISRLTQLQRMAAFVQGDQKVSLLDVMGIEAPPTLDTDQLAKLEETNKDAFETYKKAQEKYNRANEAYGTLDAAGALKLGKDKLMDTFGIGEDTATTFMNMAAGGIDGATAVDKLFTAAEINALDLSADKMKGDDDEFTLSDLKRLSADNPKNEALKTMSEKADEYLKAGEEAAKGGAGGGAGGDTIELTVKDASGDVIGTLVSAEDAIGILASKVKQFLQGVL